MSEHTKEPWEVIDAEQEEMIGNWAYASHLIVTVDKTIHEGESHAVVAVVPWIEHLVFDKLGKSEANAKRIVACVNYCEGIPTAKLTTTDPAAFERLREAISVAAFGLQFEASARFASAEYLQTRMKCIADELQAAIAAVTGGV